MIFTWISGRSTLIIELLGLSLTIMKYVIPLWCGSIWILMNLMMLKDFPHARLINKNILLIKIYLMDDFTKYFFFIFLNGGYINIFILKTMSTIPIQLKTFIGKDYDFDVDPSDKVGSLKTRLLRDVGTGVSNLSFVYNKRVLDEEKSFSEQSVLPGSVIQLQLQLKV
jgi:hypothetical protein